MLSEIFKDERVNKVEIFIYHHDKGRFHVCIQSDIGNYFNVDGEEKQDFFYVRGSTPEEALEKAYDKLKEV